MIDDISHEGLRALLREEGVSFQRLKTWKTSKDPDYAVKKARAGHLYAIADGEVIPEPGEPQVIFCVDEFGPLNLQPRPGRQWAAVRGKSKESGRAPRRRRRATYHRTGGIRHLFAAYELGQDKLFGHIKPRKTPGPVPGVLPLPALPPPTRCPDRDHLRQLQPAPEHRHRRPGRRVGRREQRRDRLHPGQCILVKPHRGPVHRAALLHPRRHRPRHPHRAGQHDPPLHQLAKPPRQRPAPPRRRRQGERCLMRH